MSERRHSERGHLGSAASFTNGFRPALSVVAGMSALGAVSALAVAERRRHATEARPEPGQVVAA